METYKIIIGRAENEQRAHIITNLSIRFLLTYYIISFSDNYTPGIYLSTRNKLRRLSRGLPKAYVKES